MKIADNTAKRKRVPHLPVEGGHVSSLNPRSAFHWGGYAPRVTQGRLVAMDATPEDPDPSPLGRSYIEAVNDDLRIRQPMVRESWLGNGPGSGTRGGEPFVALSWERALDLVAAELERIRSTFSNRAIYAGSYGWGSAGSFHFPQGQLHRFLNLFGGFVRSINTYSHAAADVAMPYIAGNFFRLLVEQASWQTIAQHSELVVAFGGMPLKNAQVAYGGVARHRTRAGLEACRQAGVEFLNIGPVKNDTADFLRAEWLTPRPNTDMALMLGLAHTLVTEGLADLEFLARYCVGFERFQPYLMGESDGHPKDAQWAANITGLKAETITTLARRMAAKRTLITIAWSLQRADHGEQSYWMAITLAAMLGQIGLPGGGFGYGYSSVATVGNPSSRIPWATLDRCAHPVEDVIPVARIADLLLNPNTEFDYNGRRATYPDIRLVYWVGGNVFHHHQDLNRLLRAWQKPETVIVHEPWWTPMARHADIILPATTPLERNDMVCTPRDSFVVANKQALEPVGAARNDHDIFADLAERLGFREGFTEGRDEAGWLRHLYALSRERASERGFALPDFEQFWEDGYFELPLPSEPQPFLSAFRTDPDTHPLDTPSGKIEIWSERIASYHYDDCPPHPTWMEPAEWLGSEKTVHYPLHLTSNQPVGRLHSQLDQGSVSRSLKVAEREPLWIHPADAQARGLSEGDIVRVFNDRGQCLAGVRITANIQKSVVQLPTGAWYDPLEPGVPGSLEKHGNPNVLTLDKGTSKLGQGPSAHTTLVQVERYQGDPPPVTAFVPPEIRQE